MSSIANRISSLIVNREGPLTRELLRNPGGFGLGQVPISKLPDATTSMVCGFCSTGCSLDVHLKNGEAINLSPSSEYSVNAGMACPKGWEALTPLSAADRATVPMIRDEKGVLRPSDWSTALNYFVDGFKRIQRKHGAESVAFLSTGQIPTEEMAFLGALSKFGMGMVHGDGNTRQCMATAVVAYKEAFGFDAPPYTYKDFEESDVLVFVGANPCIAHPIMWERVCKNRHNPEIIVIDPRATETAQQATQHIALLPKSDLVLLYGIARELIDREWIDISFIKQHTDHFADFAKHVSTFTVERVVAETGLSRETFDRLVRTIHEGKRVSFWWTMGVNQSHQGVRTAQAIINLALMTGNIDPPARARILITGQCNAMGSRLFSNTTNLLGGHAFDNPEHRKKISSILNIDESVIPMVAGDSYDRIMEGILQGTIRGLWVIATNTAHSWINQADAQEMLRKLDFLVVQDMYHSTETAAFADVVLPAAGWGEKEGTFINSERRIGMIKQVSRAPGQALSDFRIFQLIAEAWGCGAMFKEWTSPEAVFEIMKACSEGMPCDFSGIADYQTIETNRGIQWPLRKNEAIAPQSERRLFSNGEFFTENGRAKFIFADPEPMPELQSEHYPILLLTGRGSSSQWHTQTRTAKSDVLVKLSSKEPYVEINPEDADRLGVRSNDWVEVRSQRGQMLARAFVSTVVRSGQCFIPMHYAQTNQLTFPSFDPFSRQPSYKSCAVNIVRADR
ncbi:MAG: nitrate reductase [Polyangiales bacterium]